MSPISPPMMRAIEITEPGRPSVLRMTERPIPEPGKNEVRIKVAAAGVNRPDILQRRGFYPPPEGVTDIPGLEVAGTIDQIGPDATGTLGAPVMALIPGGGYAEYAVIGADQVLAIPDGLQVEEAAGFPETAYTVWANVFEAGQLAPGETLFVHGATSGIGTMAAMMARAAGATVFGSAGTSGKCRKAEAIGYAKVFNYREDDWSGEMKALGGADVVLDMVGGDYVPKNLALMKPGGRHVSIAVQGGMEATINIFDVMRRRLTLTGSTLRARPAAEKARLTREIAQHVLPWVSTGAVRPVIASTYPLADAGAAHQDLEDGKIIGKVILTL